MIFSHLPWFFSESRDLVAGRNISISSGTLRMIRYAQRAAFLRTYALGDFMSRSTSEAKSRDISGDAMAPRVHKARPTTNCTELFRSLQESKIITVHRKLSSITLAKNNYSLTWALICCTSTRVYQKSCIFHYFKRTN